MSSMYMADSGHGKAGIIFLRFIWWRGAIAKFKHYCIFLKRGFWSKPKIPFTLCMDHLEKDGENIIIQYSSPSTKCCLPPKIVFHCRLSSTDGCLPPKIVFHQRSSSTEGCLSPKVVFHQRLSSTKGHLSLNRHGKS